MTDGTRAKKAAQPQDELFDRELEQLPPEARWREWMQRVEATIFAASEPVGREALARIVGRDCSIDLLIDDIREELRGRPYDLVSVAGGWKHLTRPSYATAIRTALGTRERGARLTEADALVLMCIACYQPIRLCRKLGEETRKGQSLGRAFRRRATQTARPVMAADCGHTSPAVCASCEPSRSRPGSRERSSLT